MRRLTRKQKRYVRDFLKLESDIEKVQKTSWLFGAMAPDGIQNLDLSDSLNDAANRMRQQLEVHPLAKFLDANIKDVK